LLYHLGKPIGAYCKGWDLLLANRITCPPLEYINIRVIERWLFEIFFELIALMHSRPILGVIVYHVVHLLRRRLPIVTFRTFVYDAGVITGVTCTCAAAAVVEPAAAAAGSKAWFGCSTIWFTASSSQLSFHKNFHSVRSSRSAHALSDCAMNDSPSMKS